MEAERLRGENAELRAELLELRRQWDAVGGRVDELKQLEEKVQELRNEAPRVKDERQEDTQRMLDASEAENRRLTALLRRAGEYGQGKFLFTRDHDEQH